VGYINLFERHDKQWMNGRVRSMNLWFGQTLMRHGMSHIGVTDTSSIARQDCTKRGLHLNSRGKKRLLDLTAERVSGHLSGISSIPVITHARASPFLT
jgi:hypothetical protein